MTTIVLLVSLAAAVLYGTVLLNVAPSLGRAVAKTAAVASLAVYAVLVGGPVALVAALALSSLGDWFLAHDGERNFLAGLGSFLLAHVMLIVLFRLAGLPFDVAFAAPWRLALAGAIVVLCVAMLVWLWGHLADMRWPVVAYTATIAAMVVSACALPVMVVSAGALPGHGPAIVGAFAFAVSDSCLAVRTFRIRSGPIADRVLSPLVWWLYWGAQVLIVAGFVRLPGISA